MANADSLKAIFDRVARGEISPDEALSLIRAPRKRGRKPGARLTPRKRKQLEVITLMWVLYHDKVPKMLLRGALGEVLGMSDAQVGRVITELKRLSDLGFIGRHVDENGKARILLLTPEDFRLAQLRKSVGMTAFPPGRLMTTYCSFK